jgi:hypothetical protein
MTPNPILRTRHWGGASRGGCGALDHGVIPNVILGTHGAWSLGREMPRKAFSQRTRQHSGSRNRALYHFANHQELAFKPVYVKPLFAPDERLQNDRFVPTRQPPDGHGAFRGRRSE